MSATLVDRLVTHFGGKTYVRHRYTNGHLWMITLSDKMVTARLIVAHDGAVHHIKRPIASENIKELVQ